MLGQVRSGQVRSGQVRSGQVRSGQVRSGQVRSGQFGSVQVKFYTPWVFECQQQEARKEFAMLLVTFQLFARSIVADTAADSAGCQTS
jgi:hypothetical protein